MQVEAHYARQEKKKAENPNLGELHKPLVVAVRESSTFSPVVSLVNPSALAVAVRALVTSVTSGQKCSASYARWSPFGFWEKTFGACSPLMEVEPSEPSSMSWPRWGIAWDGACTELAMSLPRIVVSESSLWGTPKAQDSRAALTDRGKCNLGEQVHGLESAVSGSLNPQWVEWLQGFPRDWTEVE
jgi:hypothetical protein